MSTFLRSAHHALFSTLIAAGLCAAPSSVRAAPPSVTASNWTGPYVGVNAGYGWGNRSLARTANDSETAFLFGTLAAAPPYNSLNTSGGVGGLQLGYNWQVRDKWLVGIETDFEWSGMKGSAAGGGTFAPTFFLPFSADADEQVKWFGTLRARLGYLPANNVLAYLTGGLAYGKVEHSENYFNNGPLRALGPTISDPFNTALCAAAATCFTGSSSRVTFGWTLGAGLEYALSAKFTLKAEYLYVSLAGTPVTVTAVRTVNGPPEVPSTYQADFGRTSFNVARIGLNYRF